MAHIFDANKHTKTPQVKKILLIEDNPLHQKQLIASINYNYPLASIILCSTGGEALQHLKNPQIRFDLVLVDLGLPDINGLEVILAVRKRFRQVPIMVVSAITAESSLLACIRAGAQGYILKSDTVNAIQQAIHDVLQGNYPISPALARSLFKLAGAPTENSPSKETQLTPRETETLQHLSRGLSYADVAQLMGIKVSTVQSNIRIIYRKLEANSQMQAVVKARDAGMI